MQLRLYNTLTRTKEAFAPLDPSNVRMYVCGPTVYDFAHIGNARPAIVFDVLFRLLRHLYGAEHVTYVRNITDVDDKINARAAERIAQRGEAAADLNAEIRAITEETYANFKQDVAALGCLPPTFEPRATEYIHNPGAPTDMVRLIERLIASGHAYPAEGHVLFHVPSMPDYGRLARRSLDEMQAGARVEVAPYKRDPMDFVLWKPSRPGEPAWSSPWSEGRPGWHIECSAMAAALLGETFDIHGGGIDLVFPHHENEIAQSRCAFHTDVMARTWMHNGFLQVEGEKMSKSLGNFVTIRELLASTSFGGRAWDGDTIRWAMLLTHYRQPLDWTAERLDEADDELDDFARAIPATAKPAGPTSEFVHGLADDLNAPGAKAHLHKLLSASRVGDLQAARSLLANLQLLGLDLVERRSGRLAGQLDPERKLALARVFGGQTLKQVVELRLAARQAKNFAEADRIRDELLALGVVLKDSKDGTTWELAR